MDNQSALVVGGDSLIARALRIELLSAGWNVLSTTRRQEKRNGWLNFDLKHGFYSLPNAAVEKTNVVFICGAVTGFERCAKDPVGSREINVTRSLELGRSFMKRGTRVVYLSSNAVFDGNCSGLDEHSLQSPTTEYGQQKFACELGLLTSIAGLSGSCAVVRLTKVVDLTQPLLNGWMRNFHLQISIKAAADLVISPVTTSYVASGLKCIGSGEKSGVFHLSGEQDTTYYGLATAMAETLGIRSIVEEDWVRHRLGTIPSPSYSALSMVHTFNTWGIKPQNLHEVVQELVMKINKNELQK